MYQVHWLYMEMDSIYVLYVKMDNMTTHQKWKMMNLDYSLGVGCSIGQKPLLGLEAFPLVNPKI